MWDFLNPLQPELTREDCSNRLDFFCQLLRRHLILLMALNLLFFLCCLPLVTILPAVGALQYSLRRLMQGDSSLFANFFKGFGWACSRGLKMLVAQVAVLVGTAFAFWFYFENGFVLAMPAAKLAACGLGFALLFLLLLSLFWYPVVTENTTLSILCAARYCAMLVLVSFLQSFLLLVTFIGGLLLLYLYPMLFLLYSTVYFVFFGLITVFLYDYYKQFVEP